MSATAPAPAPETIIEINKLSTRFGDHVVHADLDLEVRRKEIFAVVGGSGSGKSTLLREMILLQLPSSGTIRVLGVDLQGISDADALALRQRQPARRHRHSSSIRRRACWGRCWWRPSSRPGPSWRWC